jgi:hypothetical protein
MLTPYDRKQQAAERRARAAAWAADLIVVTPAERIQPSCDWDAELAKLAPADGGAS